MPGWDLHCARLAESLQLLSYEASRPLPAFLDWCQEGRLLELPALLGDLALPSLQVAVKACRQAHGCESVLLVLLVCETARRACSFLGPALTFATQRALTSTPFPGQNAGPFRCLWTC